EIPAQNRPILEPILPSKRAAQPAAELTQRIQNSITDIHYPFFPQELAQIFEARQKQEHLWHTRLMVCTSFYSCIENAATSFKASEDKDLAIMLQENLKSKIVKFAISDADPKAYRYQHKSNTTEHIESNSVNPTLPPKLIVNMSSWSTLVRNGFKNTKAAKSPASQKTTQTQPKSSGHQPNYRLVISPSAIGRIKPVGSGFALSPCTNEAQEALLNAAICLSPFGAKLESATNWTSVSIPTVSKSLYTLNGHVEVTKELLSQEIERVTKMRPSF
ncbi:hypothetical protein EPUL_006081, partial [Erysiphe pulchra]